MSDPQEPPLDPRAHSNRSLSQAEASRLRGIRTQAGTLAYAAYSRIVRRPVAVLVVAFAVSVFGIASLDRLPVTLMPDLNYPTLTIRTDYPTATPHQVEQRVSELIEERVANVESLARWTSISKAEQSDVVLEFNWGTDMLEASAQVGEAMDRVRLAREIEQPRLLRYDPSQDPIMRLMLYGKSERMNLTRLRKIANDTLKPELSRIEGVAAVRVAGGIEEQLRVLAKEVELQKYGITISDIVNKISASDVDQSAGILDIYGREVILRVTNPYQAKEDIADLELTTSSGNTIKLREVATLDYKPEDPETITRYAGSQTDGTAREGVLLEVLKEGDANIIEASHRVWQRLYGTQFWESVREGQPYPSLEERSKLTNKLRGESQAFDREAAFGMADRFPDDLGGTVLSDQSRFIEQAVGEVQDAVIVGGLLAVLVIFFFLRSSFSTLLIAISIPLSVVATFIPMQLTDLTLNLMTLGGLALGVGMLVDNSIVVLESIARCKEEGDTTIQAAARGTSEVASAIVASTLTTIAVFFPIAFVEGMAGQIFADQALTVVYALLASLGAALLVIPAFAGLKVRAKGDNFRTPDWILRIVGLVHHARWPKGVTVRILGAPLWALNSVLTIALWLIVLTLAAFYFAALGFLWCVFQVLRVILSVSLMALSRSWQKWWSLIEISYPVLLKGALGRPVLTISTALALAGVSTFLATTLSTELIPPLNENEIYVDLKASEGTRLEDTDASASSVVEDAFEDDAIAASLRGVLVESGGDSDISGRPIGSNRARAVISVKPGQRTAEDVAADISEIAQKRVDFSRGTEISRPTLFTTRSPVAVEIRGNNLDRITLVADQVLNIMQELESEDGAPLLKEIRTSSELGKPQIPIVWDRQKLVEFDLNSEQLTQELRRKVAGEIVSEVDREAESIDIFVNIEGKDDLSIEDLGSLVIAGNRRVKELLDPNYPLREIQGPSQILRSGNERYIEITAQPNGFPLGLVRAAIDQALDQQSPAVEGTRILLTGQQEELERSRTSLIFALSLAVFLVFVVMAVQFESLIDPLLIMGTLPLAGVGVVLIMWVSGTPISVVVMLGVIILAGIVVNNAIVLIDYTNRLRERGLPVREAVIEAARVRLRPIAITTITTVLGMLPLTGWLDGALNQLASIFPDDSTLRTMLSVGGEGREVRAPMAITVVVGLISSTALTLLVIPTLYTLVHGGFSPDDVGTDNLDAEDQQASNKPTPKALKATEAPNDRSEPPLDVRSIKPVDG